MSKKNLKAGGRVDGPSFLVEGRLGFRAKLAGVGAIFLSAVTFGSTALAFSDMGPSEPASEAVSYLEKEGIVGGYPDGTFKPNNLINRAEFSKIIAESNFSKNIIESCDMGEKFPDVKKGTWYYGYVCTLYSNAVIRGYGDGQFRPEQTINFAEAAKITTRILAPALTNEEAGENWYENYTNFLDDIEATPETVKAPNQNLKRGEMAQILAKTLQNWWRPRPGTSWQWQLNGNLNLSYDVDVYDLDLFDTPKSTIDNLHQKGSKVVCYFSGGTYENWRDDAKEFPAEVLGKTMEDWPDEKWLDISNVESLLEVMTNRINLAAQKGCDGIEIDNLDGYANDTGFELSSKNQHLYNWTLAALAHEKGLAVGLKNDLDQAKELVSYFDFAVNEQCFEYEECDALLPFIERKKAVFGVEYNLEKEEFCEEANEMDFDWLKMALELDGGRDSCR